MAINNTKVVPWQEQFAPQAYALLNKYLASSLLLLTNLTTYGPKLTTASYSGNFKCLLKNDQVVAVFVLTRIGNLLVQTDRADDYAKTIVAECVQEPIQLQGVVGAWEIVQSIWAIANQQLPSLAKKNCQKALLFRLSLDTISATSTVSKYDIRSLTPTDYQQWALLNTAYLREQHLNLKEAETAQYNRFLTDVANLSWSGLFIDNQLITIANFISHINNVGQLGGVYTSPNMRRHGFAKALIQHKLSVGKKTQQMQQVILFTKETNIPAIRLYQSLGFNQIGNFGITVQVP